MLQLIALLSLILLPFTLAGGESTTWGKPRIGVMLAIGLLCVPAFAVWETKYAKFPAVPFHVSLPLLSVGAGGGKVRR